MDEDMLSDQRRLVSLLEDEGWEVSDVELSAYDSPWTDVDAPEATVKLTARKPYGDVEEDDGDDETDDNPFRVK